MTKTLYAFCVLLVFTSLPCTGQRSISVSATITPVYRYTNYGRLYLYPDSDGQVVEPVFLNGPRWGSGYSAGVTARYTYAPGWSVGAGVWYQQIALRQARPASAGEGTTTLRNRTVRVPFFINYQSSTKRLSPYFSLGLLVDFPMTSRVLVDRSGQARQRLRLSTEGGPIFHALLGAGASYQLNRRYSVLVQPTGSYNLGRFGGAATNFTSFELSLQTQVLYTF